MSGVFIDLTDSQSQQDILACSTHERIIDYEEHMHDPTCSRMPSECRCSNVGWLWGVRKDRVKNLCERSGKWMLFCSPEGVDNAWFNVVDMLADGKLGDCAKVAPASRTRDSLHVICVYTADHEDVKDVFRVLHALRCSSIPCAAERTLNYKTDDATYAGQYATRSAAQNAGFKDASTAPHKSSRVSKYTSPGFRGNRNVRLVMNNVGPNFLHEVVAEVPVAASPEEVAAFFQGRPATASEIEALVLRLGSGDEDCWQEDTEPCAEPELPSLKAETSIGASSKKQRVDL